MKSDSTHYPAALSALFNQPANPVRAYLYDDETDHHDHASLNDIVHERMAALFRLHGAVDMAPPLLQVVTSPEGEGRQAVFLDRHGEVVALPNNALVPFARLAARSNIKRIKRYHIGDVYKPTFVLLQLIDITYLKHSSLKISQRTPKNLQGRCV